MHLNKIIPFLLLAFVGCQDSTDPNPDASVIEASKQSEGITVVNGVERSELALTMRLMYDQMKLVSDSLKDGKTIHTNYLNRYKSIHTDIATEPEKIDEVYQGLAENFIAKYDDFEKSTSDRDLAFNNMLDACLACHASKCPGPIKAIKKIKLREIWITTLINLACEHEALHCNSSI